MLDDDKNSDPSAWRKVRNVVHWSPFIQTYKKQKYPWVQLAGHQGNFQSGEIKGTILKKVFGSEETCFQQLMKDELKDFVPEYKRTLTKDNESKFDLPIKIDCLVTVIFLDYLELQDLLTTFDNPSIMDVKMGVRTYLEDELAKALEKPKLRNDLYDKMIQIDSTEPTAEEHQLKAITKTRYMIWRETISSTASLGFRIEGIKLADGKTSKDFKTTKNEEQVKAAFKTFLNRSSHIQTYLDRLQSIKSSLEKSKFFKSHEFIGSSLLFVHDEKNANIWLIDFAKTFPPPNSITLTHRSKWQIGNHEDGYLIGIESLIRIFETIRNEEAITRISK